MDIKFLHQPETAIAHIVLENKEEIVAQAGALIAMKGDLDVQTLVRRGGAPVNKKSDSTQIKSLFVQSFKANETGVELYLAPPLVGNLTYYNLSQYKLIMRHSSYLASSGGIDIFVGFQPLKSSKTVDKSTWLSLFGDGLIIISAFGGLYEVDVDGSYCVNFEHIVAFENSLKVKILPKQKSWLGPLLPLQETFYEFKGQGKVFCQTHRPRDLIKLLSAE